MRVATALDIVVDPNDIVLAPRRLDLAAMKAHHFVTNGSTLENLVYKMLFIDGEEREIPLPQTTLFSISQGPLSRSKDEMDDKLCSLNFHGHYQEEAPSYDPVVHYTGESSRSYQDEGASSSYYGGAPTWEPWD